jgi:hypothetical protein
MTACSNSRSTSRSDRSVQSWPCRIATPASRCAHLLWRTKSCAWAAIDPIGLSPVGLVLLPFGERSKSQIGRASATALIIVRVAQANTLRDLPDLIRELESVEPQVLFDSLFPFAVKEQGTNNGPVAFSAYVIHAINPPCPLTPSEALSEMVKQESDISIEEVPWCLANQFGADQILACVADALICPIRQRHQSIECGLHGARRLKMHALNHGRQDDTRLQHREHIAQTNPRPCTKRQIRESVRRAVEKSLRPKHAGFRIQVWLVVGRVGRDDHHGLLTEINTTERKGFNDGTDKRVGRRIHHQRFFDHRVEVGHLLRQPVAKGGVRSVPKRWASKATRSSRSLASGRKA